MNDDLALGTVSATHATRCERANGGHDDGHDRTNVVRAVSWLRSDRR